ncbi:Superoxide dismutase, related [Eimeria tenella]|uniref:Superoxide dismutase n=1 Tax=Eimeria tenella TaxID=5802 RepID=U6KTI3_EIMTE|nr:Superoxide dismutase, related [Eimeria tenella]CDJ41281.1 Superoxide dismutase, related [Eimeria tenella]|eukprot:XP_013232031.1 Superoxide dismutase, related [Eimeria tenella]
MPFELPPLPYPMDALEPYISKETLEYHYGKHHAAYVNNLNKLVEGKPEASKSLEEIIKTSSGSVLNNAGQAWNHTFYWKSMRPASAGGPPGAPGGGPPGAPGAPLREELESAFGGVEKFREAFAAAAAAHFGSGWAWLCFCKKSRSLFLLQTHDGATPFRDNPNCAPLLTCDLWEHAYYIDRRNDRKSYLDAWWSVVNWDFANENLKKAMQGSD